MEKQRLLYQQSRLHNRGAAEMVLQMISACKGSARKRTHTHIIVLCCHHDDSDERPALTAQAAAAADNLAKQIHILSYSR